MGPVSSATGAGVAAGAPRLAADPSADKMGCVDTTAEDADWRAAAAPWEGSGRRKEGANAASPPKVAYRAFLAASVSCFSSGMKSLTVLAALMLRS